MASTEQEREQKVQPPSAQIADRGSVRLGCGWITGNFPPLRAPKPEIADRGTVRLGCGWIAGGYPDRT
jgi:hypothetical protein